VRFNASKQGLIVAIADAGLRFPEVLSLLSVAIVA
jgi:hypothetical protein